ncbi:hypothetical protein FQZ97_912610 [compost metagenome]
MAGLAGLAGARRSADLRRHLRRQQRRPRRVPAGRRAGSPAGGTARVPDPQQRARRAERAALQPSAATQRQRRPAGADRSRATVPQPTGHRATLVPLSPAVPGVSPQPTAPGRTGQRAAAASPRQRLVCRGGPADTGHRARLALRRQPMADQPAGAPRRKPAVAGPYPPAGALVRCPRAGRPPAGSPAVDAGACLGTDARQSSGAG